jgi:long-chain acyl-CoA synthetase
MQSSGSEWLETGDLGTIDESGNLIFRGRKKDVIVTSAGLNIFPEDLEAALQHQPGVRVAGVVQVSGPQGPQPFAALVMQGNASPEDAVKGANRELADYQQIRRWMLWPDPDLPRTSTGKVLRRKIAAALPALGEGPPITTGGLAAILQRITGEASAQMPDSARLSEDLHLDSLGRTELQSAIELEFGVDTGSSDFQQIQTLGELKALLRTPEPQALPQPVETSRAAPYSYSYAQWPWSTLMRGVRMVFVESIMRPLVKFLAAPNVERAIKADPPSPVLIVSNHVTEYDVPLILNALSPRMRHNIAIAMAGEMLRDFRRSRNPLERARYWLAVALFNVFPLPQQGNFRASFAHAGLAMDRGFHVLVFPEGRRTPDAQMHDFQSGSGILWTQLGCPALPVYLAGLAQIRAERGRWFRSGRITVRIGPLLQLPPNADPKQATALLERSVRNLAEPRAS